MFTFQYLLSYSVKPQHSWDDTHKEKADNVRNKIARITEKGWTKLEDIETTFKGSFDAQAISEEQRKAAAIKFVESRFIEILQSYKATRSEVKIDCAMMISEVKESFKFTI